jgi:hypothetical protein
MATRGWLTGVYGPNDPKVQQEYWEELAGLVDLCGKKWCTARDFNVVRFPSKKFKVKVTRSMRDFDDLI